MDEELLNYLVSVEADNCHFAFRWLLLQFKREVDYDGVQLIWETLWTAKPHFHLFMVLAILEKVRDHIMMENMQFDELLQMCNRMSGKLDYVELIGAASYWMQLWESSYPEEIRDSVLL